MMARNPLAKQPELPGAVPGDAPAVRRQIISFLDGFSIEIMPRAAVQMASARDHLQPETKVYVTFVSGSDFADVIATAKRLRQEGFNPVPHFAARGIASREQFEEQLKRVCTEAGVDEVLVIGGDLGKPVGQFHCSMQLLETGLLDKYGIRRIGVAGHPEGNRDIGEAGLGEALAQKNDFARRTEAEIYIMTQFCFEPAAIIAWDKTIRTQGNKLPIHVGVPGTTTVKSLIGYARTCGIGPSLRVLTRNLDNVAKLARISTPDRLVTELARYKAADSGCGIRQAHFYPFGALARTARWLDAVRHGNFTMRTDGKGFTV